MRAAPQASGETETRIKVFVSYSRADKAFASDLVLGLAACGFAPYIDRQDIAPGEDWEKRLQGLISEADSIVYIVSPDSLASENCGQEFRQAIALRKRILPVVWRTVDDAAAPPEMKRLNYIFFSGEGRTFATGLAELAAALRTDIGWIREHTRLAELAGRWAARSRPAGLLLRGDDIDAANAWLADKPITAPAVTDDQADFIKASTDARAEAERRARRARAGLLTAVSLTAVVFAGLAGAAAWQWSLAGQNATTAQQALADLKVETDKVKSAQLRLEADVWLRTAPSESGYYVVETGWYPVVANYSGAIARVVREGGGHPTWMQTGFIIDGALVHPRYAGEPLLVLHAEQATQPATPLKWQPPTTPDDTLPALSDEDAKILEIRRQDEERAAEAARRARGMPPQGTARPPSPDAQPGPVRTSTSPTRPPGVAPSSPDDTLSADDPDQVQRIITAEELRPGPEIISVTFPALKAPQTVLTASEMVWRTPVHLGGERPFQIWRLNAAPPFGWRAIAETDIDCRPFGPTPSERTVAMLSIAIRAEGVPSDDELALNISELLTWDVAQAITYTHSTNRAAGGSPVFDLAGGKVIAVHVSSRPNLTGPRAGTRTSEGYAFRHLIDMARSSIDEPKLGPLCQEASVP